MDFLETDRIETPENVELERRLAGIGSRFLAGLLDNLILLGALLALVLTGVIIVLATNASWSDLGETGGMVLLAGVILAFFLLYWGYFIYFEMRRNGQTPGKRIMRIRVVRQDGGPITFLDILIRNLLRAVDGIAAYGVGGLVMFFSRRSQRLGDLAAGTVVVSEQMPDYAAQSDRPARGAWESEVNAPALQATGLKPEEYRVLSNYWARRNELTFGARQRVLPQLVRPILQRTGETLHDESITGLEDYVFHLLSQAAAAQGQAAPPAPPAWPPPPRGAP